MTAKGLQYISFSSDEGVEYYFIEVSRKLMGVVLKGIWFKWVYM